MVGAAHRRGSGAGAMIGTLQKYFGMRFLTTLVAVRVRIAGGSMINPLEMA